MHRTCAEYRNENLTRMHDAERHLMLYIALNSRPVPRRVGCFTYLPKFEISSCIAAQNFEVVYGLKFIYANFQDNRFINELAQAL